MDDTRTTGRSPNGADVSLASAERQSPTAGGVGGQPSNPEWPRCAQSFRAAFLLALPAVPFVALILTLAIYAAPPTSTLARFDAVAAGAVLSLVLWLLFAILQQSVIRGTSADQVNASAYKELRHQIGEITAIRAAMTPTDVASRIGAQQLDTYLEQTRAELGQSGPDWILGSGYISVWSLVHRAEETLLLTEPSSQVISSALWDEQRLTGSQIDNSDQLLSKLRLALARLDPNAASYLSGRPNSMAAADGAAMGPSADTEMLARVALREVRQTINNFRDTSWAAIVRSRNHLMATLTATGLATYLGLTLTIALTNASRGPDPASNAVLAAAAYYLLGSMVGLFNRLSIESGAQNDVEDYGLTMARLSLTPVLSGLAAVGGVFITAVAANGVAGAVLGQAGVLGPLPSLAGVYNLSANPLGLLLAAVFGLSPSMLIGALQAQADRYASALKSTAPQSH